MFYIYIILYIQNLIQLDYLHRKFLCRTKYIPISKYTFQEDHPSPKLKTPLRSSKLQSSPIISVQNLFIPLNVSNPLNPTALVTNYLCFCVDTFQFSRSCFISCLQYNFLSLSTITKVSFHNVLAISIIFHRKVLSRSQILTQTIQKIMKSAIYL